MKKFPKYIIVPLALLVYFLAVMAYSINERNGELPPHFVVTILVEIAILVIIFFLLRHREKK